MLTRDSARVLRTHYASIKFPVEKEKVCEPNGLEYGYYDSVSGIWPGRRHRRASFAHHCTPSLDAKSPFAPLFHLQSFRVDGDGPSSYEIVSSQAGCPQGLNLHEYVAFQSLLSGKSRRWI